MASFAQSPCHLSVFCLSIDLHQSLFGNPNNFLSHFQFPKPGPHVLLTAKLYSLFHCSLNLECLCTVQKKLWNYVCVFNFVLSNSDAYAFFLIFMLFVQCDILCQETAL